MSETLDHARREHTRVRAELEEREWVLTGSLVADVQEHLNMAGGTLEQARQLVREIPGQASLDHSGVKREVIKELEEMEKRAKALCDKVANLEQP